MTNYYDQKDAQYSRQKNSDNNDPSVLFDTALKYYHGRGVAQNWAEALRYFKLAADQGHADAQHYLGVMYENGHGVAQNDSEALRWCRLAADQGHTTAQCMLGWMYADGEKVAQNDSEALRWFKLAADQGDAAAQYMVGWMYVYANGGEVAQNYSEASRWFKLAADQGDADAQYELGWMYANGEGVPQNYSEAFRWYKLAADRGIAGAQYALGLMYENGHGVAQDYSEAFTWLKHAADQEYSEAQRVLGVFFLNGYGVQQNYIEATNWFEKAVQNGNDKAASLLEECRQKMGADQSATDSISFEEAPAHSATTLDKLRSDLSAMIGLGSVKTDVDHLIKLISVQRLRKSAGLKIKSLSLHCVFLGSPGTGKTTVARLYGAMLKELGLLSKGHLIETDRTGLVAGYVGQTELKTDAIIKSALGGVLFIDEAYSLYKGSDTDWDYGQEAISVLLKRMEDNRDDFVVIVAGYAKPMDAFLESNEGIKSRFPNKITFPDYSPTELVSIFELFCIQNDYKIQPQALDLIKYVTENQYRNRDDSFGNARLMRNLFEDVVKAQSVRIAETLSNPSADDLMTIVADDVRHLISEAS